MKKGRKGKMTADIVVLLCILVLGGIVLKDPGGLRAPYILFGVLGGVFLFFCADLYLLYRRQTAEADASARPAGIERLILLDEQDQPVRSWDMAGRTALIIGKKGAEEVDVDLADCAYSCFIDYQHAVLNFSLDCWYVEDLASQNGIKVKKVEDGQRYKVMERPCRVTAGDILYIANTKLLLS